MSLKKKIDLCREFGFKVLFSDMCATNIRIPKLTSRWKDRVILQWLRENYGQVLEKYQSITSSSNQANNNASDSPIDSLIWSMWWQGEENAPEIVKLCLSSIRKHCGDHDLRIITQDNYHEYINLPEHITDRVKAGIITLTHFSDIIRMYLLSHYGGMWIDATILVTKNIPEDIFAGEYFTVNRKFNIYDRNVSMQRWTGFLQAARKNNILCSFSLDLLLEYWKTHNSMIDYVLIDYVIALAYEAIPECRKILDSVPINNTRIDDMRELLSSEYDAEIYDELTSETNFFKLTYKQKFPKNIAGHETLYGHLMHK